MAATAQRYASMSIEASEPGSDRPLPRFLRALAELVREELAGEQDSRDEGSVLVLEKRINVAAWCPRGRPATSVKFRAQQRLDRYSSSRPVAHHFQPLDFINTFESSQPATFNGNR